MNIFRDHQISSCYFHPKEKVVGVCALCLNERLLILASKRGDHHHSSTSRNTQRRTQNSFYKRTPINLSKIFAFSSFINRLEFRHWKQENSDTEASTSREDSFISIDFGKNGVGSWEKNKVSEATMENCSSLSWNHDHHHLDRDKETKTVIEHGKARTSSLRWRKRIGHLFQLIRRKRSNKGTVCHVSNKVVEGVKTRRRSSWIRTLTRSRNNTE